MKQTITVVDLTHQTQMKYKKVMQIAQQKQCSLLL